MGADAEVYLFDTVVFHEQVVPFFRKLIRHGTLEQALDESMDRIRPHFETIQSFLEQDFRLLPEHHHLVETDNEQWAGWDKRACRRWDCPVRDTCPFHISDSGNLQADVIAMLFGAVVRATCLGQSQFVGRSVNVSFYKDVLSKNGVPLDSELWGLLFSLGARGFVIGYEFSNSDGIHGWLMPEEADRLASLLQPLVLPPLEPTFEAMKKTKRGCGYGLAGWEFEELSLAFVRTVATIAAVQGKGILWGNDVSSWLCT